ncbi:Isopentenyl-diphosphate Delta-isomerase II [Vitis vinifera]|uniref:Isopentenyl-diphosphate Delta-isomerase II n=1 Tax=Vitis vinifera TaxID=29760 RepID=A0A438J868_VITVI|nr:Isopentenyl-diphosphate Delta-isomerase II [Vitis vinifera]
MGPTGTGLPKIRSSAIVSITCDKRIITGGHVDNSIRLISSDGAKALETARGHCAPVTCLALSPDSNYLVTGSRDTTVLLWRIHRASVSHASSISKPSTASGTPTSTSSNTSKYFGRQKQAGANTCLFLLSGACSGNENDNGFSFPLGYNNLVERYPRIGKDHLADEGLLCSLGGFTQQPCYSFILNLDTNTCCSHPLYRESDLINENVLGVRNAAQRKLLGELGIPAEDASVDQFTPLGCMLYTAPSDGKWGEHEFDYLLFTVRDTNVNPNPDEVDDVKLVIDNFCSKWWDHVEKGTLLEATDMKTIHKLT